MILLPNIALPRPARGKLDEYQALVDSRPSYVKQVAEAKRLFSKYNTRTNATFRTVRSKLTEMCGRLRRCNYCEDSYADEVEHIRPKDLYPEQTFVWENYLYACGPCNGPKNNHFAVFDRRSGRVREVARKRGDPIERPPGGAEVLIDPRKEDPLDYMILDLTETFLFVPLKSDGSAECERAAYTITILRLNNRAALAKARESAFGAYRARLVEYRIKKAQGADREELSHLAEGVRSMPHPTVWHEMKRQRSSHADLEELFEAVPEALRW